jgi:diaminopropionate ammonia-lyase
MLTVNGRLSHFHHAGVDRNAGYPQSLEDLFSVDRCREAQQTITQWPGYQATALHRLESLTATLGISRVYYKDESRRFHLKSFKALGGAYAVARQLLAHLQAKLGTAVGIDDLLQGSYRDLLNDVVISCATDGNHGRSVAWGCQMFGCRCIIYIHRDVSSARQQAMENLGAEVIRISGNYDDSIKQANSDARRHGRLIVSDTSYPGYMEFPKDVALG